MGSKVQGLGFRVWKVIPHVLLYVDEAVVQPVPAVRVQPTFVHLLCKYRLFGDSESIEVY